MTSVRMQSTTTARLVLLSLAVAVLTLALGCDKDKSPVQPTPSKYFKQTSLTNCVRNLREAYLEQSIDEYSKLFANDFTYIFNTKDVNDPNNPTPPFWGIDLEREATEGMFTAETVDRIDLNFDLSPETDSSLYPGWKKVYAPNVRLSMDTRAEDGSALTLATPGDGTVTFFGKANAAGVWLIERWEDQPVEGVGLAKTDVTSWGQVKNLYR